MKLCKEAEKGFTFQCQGCGRCCSNEIDGYVYLYMDDIKNMATSVAKYPWKNLQKNI